MDLKQIRADGMTLAQLAHNRAGATGERDDVLFAATLEAFMVSLLDALEALAAQSPAALGHPHESSPPTR